MPGYFEGWYFKQQSDKNVIALIPALHTDRHGNKTGSLQVVTPDKSYWLELPGDAVSIDRRTMTAAAGGSLFSPGGLMLDIHQKDLNVSGLLTFGSLTKPRGDIMGPFEFVPLMECRHSVFSLMHTVDGGLTVNGTYMDFTGGTGYIEGDRGRSFPKRYIWTQCTWRDKDQSIKEPSSLMLSVADVRPFGMPFVGIIGFVYFGGREHRIATYRGAKLLSAGGGAVSVRQGDYTLTARLLEDDTSRHALRAPSSGEMVRLIKEGIACRARYTFSVKESVLFDFITDKASFEYEFES